MQMGDENSSGDRWKEVMEKLSSIEDLQNITQLDIINMKNEIEKLRLVTGSAVPEEVREKVVQLEGFAKDSEIFKKWKQTIEEVKFLRSKVMGSKPQEKSGTGEMESIRREIESIRKEMETKKLPSAQIDSEGLRRAIEENRKTIDSLKSMVSGRPSEIPDFERIRTIVNENRKLVEELRSKARDSFSGVPAEAHVDIEGLHEEITRLEKRISEIASREASDLREEKDEISGLRKDLFAKLEDLNRKFSPESSGGSKELRDAIEANRASIERLKSIVRSGEGGGEVEIASPDGLKEEVEKNRKFIEDIRRMVLSGRSRGKVQLPPDPNVRKQMLKIEQKVESLGRKLQKMNNIKPIKLPKIVESKASGNVKHGDLEDVRKKVEDVLSRMEGFVTKEDIEKGFIEKRMKADGKLIKDKTFDEMNEIKKAIVRNEDHINNLVTDVEELKKEMGSVEKREWGKVSDMPDIEELRGKIADLEDKLKKTKKEPLFIE